MLTKGEKRDQDRATLVKLMEQHLDYVEKMGNERKFLFDGTMMDDGALRGFIIVKAASIAEAKTLAEGDAMVQAGRVAYEVHPCMSESGALEKAGDAAPATH